MEEALTYPPSYTFSALQSSVNAREERKVKENMGKTEREERREIRDKN